METSVSPKYFVTGCRITPTLKIPTWEILTQENSHPEDCLPKNFHLEIPNSKLCTPPFLSSESGNYVP